MASINQVKNIALDDTATASSTATVSEPTVAALGDEVFYTGNWFTSHSGNGGSTWTFVNPFNEPFPAGGPGTAGAFCCDQIVVHERSRNLWILVLQYTIGPGGTNIFRVAVSTSGKPGPPWTSFAFAPDPALGTNKVEFDFPQAATSDSHLYVSYNVYSAGNFAGANVFQIGLDALANLDLTGAVSVLRTAANELGSWCLTRGATTDMFFASHDGTGNRPLTVFRWPDAPGASITRFDVTPSAWHGSFTSDPGAFSSRGPDGEWLQRLDSRVLGGWVVGNQAGFMWAALPGTGRPQPYIKAVVVDTNSRNVLFEPDIFSDQQAFAYPSAFPNRAGKVGLSLFFGGGQFNPSHAVTWLDGQSWVAPFLLTRSSTNAPVDRAWGDYCSCAVHAPEATNWVASGYTLQGGKDPDSIEPQYVEFAEGP
jgi:hypothetical protein